MIKKIEKDYDRQISDDKKISIAIMSSFAILTIQYLILIIFNLIGTTIGSYIQLVSKVIVGLFYLFALPTVLRRSKVKFIGVYLFAIMIFLFNHLVFKENIPYIKTIIFPFFFICLPTFIYAYSIDDWNVLKDIMNKTSLIVFVMGTLIGVLIFTNIVYIGAYSMSLSYYMLLPTIIYIDEFLEKVTFKSTIILVISLIIILALGSRGAIMCVGVFVILKLVTIKKSLNYKTVLSYLLISGLLVVMIIFLKDILEYAYNLLMKFGINSRSIRLFLRDEVYLSGRDRIYKDIFENILKAPFLGIGLAADRRILHGNNSYVHNIFIEVLVNFGVVMGGLINVFLLYFAFKPIFIKDIKKSDMIIIWISIGFAHLLVSSSYLIDFKFWIYLGLGLKYLNTKKKKIKLNEG